MTKEKRAEALSAIEAEFKILEGRIDALNVATRRMTAEAEKLRSALEEISALAGNIPDDILCSLAGNARHRGQLFCAARDVARSALGVE